MELTVLGSGTCCPSLERNPSGYALEAGGQLILLDTGPGVLRRILEADLKQALPNAVDAIFYSHLHADHTTDLIPFLFSAKHAPGMQRSKELLIAGPPGFREFFERLGTAFGSCFTDPPFPLQVRECGEETFETEYFRAMTLPILHTASSIGWRIEGAEGKSVAYSGDADVCESLVRLARGADLLIIECSMPDGEKIPGHLTPSEAGKIAREAGVKSALLTHLYPPCEKSSPLAVFKSEFSGPATLARDGMKIVI